MKGGSLARTRMSPVATAVVPIEGDVPPAGVAIACVAGPQGPVVTIAISDGAQGLVALVLDPEQEPVIDQLIAAMERAGTMAAPRPEPEVRRDV